MAPANIKKEGSFFDLPISLGLLCDLDKIENASFEDYFVIGELSLDGSINKINGVLPMCIEAYRLGIKKAIIPYENRFEASVVKGIDIYPVKHLLDVIDHLTNARPILPFKIELNDYFSNLSLNNLDFSSVKGQDRIKRALEIAAAGSHNCLLIRKSRLTEKL